MKTISENKKAGFKYQILEKFQAGIVLTGQEVKSIKMGRINLAGSFVVLRAGEVFLIGANVPPYQPKNAPKNYNPKRDRKLLLKKTEINKIIGKAHQKGLTMVPLLVYTIKSKIKLEFAIVRGKKKADKREKIRKRKAAREIERALKARGTKSFDGA